MRPESAQIRFSNSDISPPRAYDVGARADLVDREPVLRLLMLAENPLEQAHGRVAIEVVLLDILVVKLRDQALDVHAVAVDLELLPVDRRIGSPSSFTS